MATPPIICPIVNNEVSYFDKCTFTVSDGSNTINTLNLCNYILPVDDFFAQTTKLRGGSAFLLDDSGLGNLYGEIKFLFIKVEYSSSFINDSDKFINMIYEGNTYPIGELHIWTGEPGNSAGLGITVAQSSGSPNISPSFKNGGITLYNPHTGSVTIKSIIAASIVDIPTIDETSILGDSNPSGYNPNTYAY
jgi:hypothetical protein